MGLLYLSNVATSSADATDTFGYPTNFNGIGIFINSRTNRRDKSGTQILGIKNDGSKLVNIDAATSDECYQPVRNKESFAISLEYDYPYLKVSVDDIPCFTLHTAIHYKGYFVLTGASGHRRPD